MKRVRSVLATPVWPLIGRGGPTRDHSYRGNNRLPGVRGAILLVLVSPSRWCRRGRDRAVTAVDVDLDDTGECPIAESCESCSTTEDLAVGTAGTTLGVYCLTLCGTCCARPLPSMDLLDALTRVGRHCQHLGIDLDAMASLTHSV